MATRSKSPPIHVFGWLNKGEEELFNVLSFSDLNKLKNDDFVLLLPVLTFGTISAVHFPHFSTHTTYGI